jgi:hypothetical protein
MRNRIESSPDPLKEFAVVRRHEQVVLAWSRRLAGRWLIQSRSMNP